MRRKDREKDTTFAYDVVAKCEYATLAMVNSENKPYCIPVSPVLIGTDIYFHSAAQGEKCDIIKANSNICFSAVCDTELVAQNFTTKYKSAVASGICTLVTNNIEKKNILIAIAEKYAKSNLASADSYIEKYLDSMSVYKIIVDKITGKGKV